MCAVSRKLAIKYKNLLKFRIYGAKLPELKDAKKTFKENTWEKKEPWEKLLLALTAFLRLVIYLTFIQALSLALHSIPEATMPDQPF